MNVTEKSRTASLLLTILLGPLGALYGSLVGGVILIALAIISAPTVIGPVVCWIIAIFVSDSGVVKHNEGVKRLLGALENNKKDD